MKKEKAKRLEKEETKLNEQEKPIEKPKRSPNKWKWLRTTIIFVAGVCLGTGGAIGTYYGFQAYRDPYTIDCTAVAVSEFKKDFPIAKYNVSADEPKWRPDKKDILMIPTHGQLVINTDEGKGMGTTKWCYYFKFPSKKPYKNYSDVDKA